jgi:SAM-dependent methyltransferase
MAPSPPPFVPISGKARDLQERLYRFPYHHIPSWDGRVFSQVVSLTWGYEYVAYLTFVLDALDGIEFETLLDVGCGDGRLLTEAHRRHPSRRVTGIDTSRRAILWARACSPDLDWIHGDIADGTSLSGCYDVVTLIDTLEHVEVPDVPRFLDGIRRHVHEDGRLIVTVPSRNVPVSAHHVQHFDLAGLAAVLSGRFSIERVVHLNRISRFVTALVRSVMHNGSVIVVNRTLVSRLFRWYRERYLIGDAADTKRIFVVCRPSEPERG